VNENSPIFLVQTDTTVGFLCSDLKKLSSIKGRSTQQKAIQAVDSLATLKQNTNVPKKFRNFVRRSQKTTFIYPSGDSFRVVSKNSEHHHFLSKFGKLYSSSANYTQKKFDRIFAIESCDIIVGDDFTEESPSKIYKLTKTKSIRVR
jgi:tRNA A37 threonylcarbamoyladenosine synthetase subunit TsaC/SUA5/YrdC